MESTRPIRALMRGLDALTVLNMRDGATVSEVAHEIRLPRTTVYRILETLCNAGFVFRDASDDRYRLTIMVRTLSGGFDDEAWVTQIAKPLIHDLCREIVWPVSIATLSGTTMVVRESTDHLSPLAIERYSAGSRAPLLTTAAGRVYLAFCPPSQRETLIEILARSAKEDDKLARAQRTDLQRMLTDIKAQGFATLSYARRRVEEISLSVPILLDDRVLACLTVRFASSAVPLKAGLERFLPKLRQCAAKISTSFAEQQAKARLSDGVASTPLNSARSV
ncbi:MAG: IclR family transcriptional regulator C-terminal domain-containing protein [Steroidobacteraceae bacterium]